jgi:hypothetical protein
VRAAAADAAPARGTASAGLSSLASTEASLDDTRPLFASRTILEHLTRGLIAAGLVAWVLLDQSPHLLLTALALIAALIAMRGRPLCWVIGLVETVVRGRGPGVPRCDC